MINSSEYYPPNFPPGLLAVPATEWMYTRSVHSLVGLLTWLPPGSGVEINQRSSSVVNNRNELIEHFLSHRSLEWLLFLDSDMTPEPETACRLLSHNVDIVGALYFSRDGRYVPMFSEVDVGFSSVLVSSCNPTDVSASARDLRQVDWVGTGCMLIRRRVLEAMRPPYMEFGAPGLGEDVVFCRRARELGFGVYVDASHCVGHLMTAPVDRRSADAARALRE